MSLALLKDFLILFSLFCCTGIKVASTNLRNRIIDDLATKMFNQPLSKCSEENIKINREDFYVDLTVLDSAELENEKEPSNSDWKTMKEKRLKKGKENKSIQLNKIIKQEDESVFIRGVGGTEKTTLLEMYTLRWAKNHQKGIKLL